MIKKDSAEKTIRDIRRKTRRYYSSEEKIRIVLEGLRGEESIATLYRLGGIRLRPQALMRRHLGASSVRRGSCETRPARNDERPLALTRRPGRRSCHTSRRQKPQ